MPIQIQRKQLRAALYFAGTADIRQYLNGVYVEPTATMTRLTSTTGSMLSIQRHVAKNADVPAMIVPREVCEQAVALKIEELTIEPLGGRFSIGGAGLNRYLFQPLEGRFPDVSRMVPNSPSGVPAHFNPELPMAFVRAGKALGVKGMPIVRQNGNAGAIVHFYAYDDFIGVLMPVSHFTEKRPDIGFPTWAGE